MYDVIDSYTVIQGAVSVSVHARDNAINLPEISVWGANVGRKIDEQGLYGAVSSRRREIMLRAQ